jgi:hypothetical protein
VNARAPRDPCRHANLVHRITSHSDAEVDERGGWKNIHDAMCSVWVCDRDQCIEWGKRYVAFNSLRTPIIEGKRTP